jgi:hypothetical protein
MDTLGAEAGGVAWRGVVILVFMRGWKGGVLGVGVGGWECDGIGWCD